MLAWRLVTSSSASEFIPQQGLGASLSLAVTPAACGVEAVDGAISRSAALHTLQLQQIGRFGAVVALQTVEVSASQASDLVTNYGCWDGRGVGEDAEPSSYPGPLSSLQQALPSDAVANSPTALAWAPAAPVLSGATNSTAATLNTLSTFVSLCPESLTVSLSPGQEVEELLEITNLRSDEAAAARFFRFDGELATEAEAALAVSRLLRLDPELRNRTSAPAPGSTAAYAASREAKAAMLAEAASPALRGGAAPTWVRVLPGAAQPQAAGAASAAAPGFADVAPRGAAQILAAVETGEARSEAVEVEAASNASVAAPVPLVSGAEGGGSSAVGAGSTGSLLVALRYARETPAATLAAAARAALGGAAPGSGLRTALSATVVVWLPWGEARLLRVRLLPRLGPPSTAMSAVRPVVVADAAAASGACGSASQAAEAARLGAGAAGVLSAAGGFVGVAGGNNSAAVASSAVVVAGGSGVFLPVAVLELRDAFGVPRLCGQDALAARVELLSVPAGALTKAAQGLAPRDGASLAVTSAGHGLYLVWLAPYAAGVHSVRTPLTSPARLDVEVLPPSCCRVGAALAGQEEVQCGCAPGHGGPGEASWDAPAGAEGGEALVADALWRRGAWLPGPSGALGASALAGAAAAGADAPAGSAAAAEAALPALGLGTPAETGQSATSLAEQQCRSVQGAAALAGQPSLLQVLASLQGSAPAELPGVWPGWRDVGRALRNRSAAAAEASQGECAACAEGSESAAAGGVCRACGGGRFSPGGGEQSGRCYACPPNYVSDSGGCADGRLSAKRTGVWWHDGRLVSAPALAAVAEPGSEAAEAVVFHVCPVDGNCLTHRFCALSADPSLPAPPGLAELALETGAAVWLHPAPRLAGSAGLAVAASGRADGPLAAEELAAAAWSALPAILVPEAALVALLTAEGAADPSQKAAECDVDAAAMLRAAEAALTATSAAAGRRALAGSAQLQARPVAAGQTPWTGLAAVAAIPDGATALALVRALGNAAEDSSLAVAVSPAAASNASLPPEAAGCLSLLDSPGAAAAGRAPCQTGVARVEPARARAYLRAWRRQQGACAAGHHGPLCGQCLPGWAVAGFGRCARCLGEPWQNVAVLAAVVVALLLVGVYWIKNRVMRSRSRTTSSGAQRILLSFLQIVALVTTLRTRTPRLFTGAGQAASGIGDGVSLELFPVDCALGLGFYAKLYIYAFLPVVCFAVSGAIVACCCAPCGRCKTKPLGKLVLSGAAALQSPPPAGGASPLAATRSSEAAVLDHANPLHRKPASADALQERAAEAAYEEMMLATASHKSALKTYIDLWVAVSVVLVFLVYSKVFRALVDVFTVYPFPLEGALRLQADLTVAANTPEHALATAVASIALLAYAFGIPTCTVVMLCRNRRLLYPMTQEELDELRLRGELTADALREAVARHSFFTRFSFTYDGTRPGMFWWEAVVLSRKVMVSLAAALIQSPVMQAIAAASILALALVLQLLVKPYALYGLNALEAVSLTTSLVILLGSTLYWRMDQDLTQGLTTQAGFDARETALTIILLCVLLAALALLLGSMAGRLSVKALSACCGGKRVEDCFDQVDSACRHRSMMKRRRGAAVASVLKPPKEPPAAASARARPGTRPSGAAPMQEQNNPATSIGTAGRTPRDRAERLVWGATSTGKAVAASSALNALALQQFKGGAPGGNPLSAHRGRKARGRPST